MSEPWEKERVYARREGDLDHAMMIARDIRYGIPVSDHAYQWAKKVLIAFGKIKPTETK